MSDPLYYFCVERFLFALYDEIVNWLYKNFWSIFSFWNISIVVSNYLLADFHSHIAIDNLMRNQKNILARLGLEVISYDASIFLVFWGSYFEFVWPPWTIELHVSTVSSNVRGYRSGTYKHWPDLNIDSRCTEITRREIWMKRILKKLNTPKEGAGWVR